MQIKTALSIGLGIVMGTGIGMCVNEDSKARFFGRIRKKLIEALGGMEKPIVKSNVSHCSYTGYYNKQKVEKQQKYGVPQELFIFETEKEAREVYTQVRKELSEYGTFSVHQLASLRNVSLDYTWDNYGWLHGDVADDAVFYVYKYDDPNDGFRTKWKLALPKASLLK